MDNFLFYLVSGICAGALYALIALGYSMVYGIIKLINFAHGEFYMAGAYAGFGVFTLLPQSMPGYMQIPIILAASGIAGALVAAITERVAYRPLRNSDRLTTLLTAIGVSFLLQGLATFINKANPLQYSGDLPGSIGELSQRAVNVGGAGISLFKIIYIFVAIILSGLLWLLVMKTSFGRAVRAVSQDARAAALMGINADSVIQKTFMAGGFLAGVAGSLAAFQSVVDPMMGFMPGLKAFIAAVLGGIGSIPGAVVGGFAIGVIENMALYFGVSSGYKDAAALVTLIAVLLVMPGGIFGKSSREKV